jgi:hypothetical protein
MVHNGPRKVAFARQDDNKGFAKPVAAGRDFDAGKRPCKAQSTAH